MSEPLSALLNKAAHAVCAARGTAHDQGRWLFWRLLFRIEHRLCEWERRERLRELRNPPSASKGRPDQ